MSFLLGLLGGGGLGSAMTGMMSAKLGQSPFLRVVNSMTGANTGGAIDVSQGAGMQGALNQAAQAPAPAQQPRTPVVTPTTGGGNGPIDHTQTIINSAKRWGVDPRTALKVAGSEGGTKGWQQSKVKRNGVYEPSFGPFQLLVGGGDTGFPEGMGNQFMKETGLDPRDPKNAEAAIDFAMQQASQHGWGQWYGAAKVGVGKFDGIGGQSSGQPFDYASAKGAKAGQYAGGPSAIPQAGGQQGTAMDRVLAALSPSVDTPAVGVQAGVERDGQPTEVQRTPMQRVIDAAMGDQSGGDQMQAAASQGSGQMEQPQAVDLGAEEIAGLSESLMQRQSTPQQRAEERKQKIKKAARMQA